MLSKGSYNFEVVKECIYLRAAAKSKNDKWFCEESQLLTGVTMGYGKIKLVLCKTLILPVILHGAETWLLTDIDLTLGSVASYITPELPSSITSGGLLYCLPY